MSDTDKKSLAERCFDEQLLGFDVFDEVNKILGSPTESCLDDGFKWQCVDTSTDYYDWSIEVKRPAYCKPMTRAQADAILAHGFDIVFETIGDGSTATGTRWTLGHSQECHPAPSRGVDAKIAELRMLRAEACELRKTCERYKKLRRLNVEQFRDLFIESLRGPRQFDDLVDSLSL